MRIWEPVIKFGGSAWEYVVNMSTKFYNQSCTMNGSSILPVSGEELGRFLQAQTKMNLQVQRQLSSPGYC